MTIYKKMISPKNKIYSVNTTERNEELDSNEQLINQMEIEILSTSLFQIEEKVFIIFFILKCSFFW